MFRCWWYVCGSWRGYWWLVWRVGTRGWLFGHSRFVCGYACGAWFFLFLFLRLVFLVGGGLVGVFSLTGWFWWWFILVPWWSFLSVGVEVHGWFRRFVVGLTGGWLRFWALRRPSCCLRVGCVVFFVVVSVGFFLRSGGVGGCFGLLLLFGAPSAGCGLVLCVAGAFVFAVLFALLDVVFARFVCAVFLLFGFVACVTVLCWGCWVRSCCVVSGFLASGDGFCCSLFRGFFPLALFRCGRFLGRRRFRFSPVPCRAVASFSVVAFRCLRAPSGCVASCLRWFFCSWLLVWLSLPFGVVGHRRRCLGVWFLCFPLC